MCNVQPENNHTMNAVNIASSTAMAFLGGGIVAGIIGAVSGVMSEKKRLACKEAVARKMPEIVAQQEDMCEPILVFANSNNAHIDTLEKLSRRCESLLKLYGRIYHADPRTVHLGLLTTAKEVEASIQKYLRLFYKESRIPLIRTVTNELQPVNRELKQAQELLLTSISGYVHSINMLVKRKFEQGVAMNA